MPGLAGGASFLRPPRFLIHPFECNLTRPPPYSPEGSEVLVLHFSVLHLPRAVSPPNFLLPFAPGGLRSYPLGAKKALTSAANCGTQNTRRLMAVDSSRWLLSERLYGAHTAERFLAKQGT